MKYFLSIDAGTSVIKSVIFNSNFKQIAIHSINNPVQSYVADSKPAQAQQDPTAGPAPLPDELVGPQQDPPAFDFLNSWNPRAWNNPNP